VVLRRGSLQVVFDTAHAEDVTAAGDDGAVLVLLVRLLLLVTEGQLKSKANECVEANAPRRSRTRPRRLRYRGAQLRYARQRPRGASS
jgi:hypothetical protein